MNVKEGGKGRVAARVRALRRLIHGCLYAPSLGARSSPSSQPRFSWRLFTGALLKWAQGATYRMHMDEDHELAVNAQSGGRHSARFRQQSPDKSSSGQNNEYPRLFVVHSPRSILQNARYHAFSRDADSRSRSSTSMTKKKSRIRASGSSFRLLRSTSGTVLGP